MTGENSLGAQKPLQMKIENEVAWKILVARRIDECLQGLLPGECLMRWSAGEENALLLLDHVINGGFRSQPTQLLFILLLLLVTTLRRCYIKTILSPMLRIG